MNLIETKPIRIAEIPYGKDGGVLGLSLAPGKKGVSYFGGSHDRNLDVDLDAIRDWGAAAVVTLMLGDELERFAIGGIGKGVTDRFMEWHHLPIVDGSVPDAAFERIWPDISSRLRALLLAGNRVYVHCRGGLGRAGLVSARLLVENGMEAEAAIAAVRAARSPHALETVEQEDWARAGRRQPVGRTTHPKGMKDRAIGALVGLAVGDAVGTTIEFTSKPDKPVLFDMVGGGPFQLDAGVWTDDTSMAMALAESLLAHPSLDPNDLMEKFIAWYRSGAYSPVGRCFDIGATTSHALHRYETHGDPIAGDTHSKSAGNGSIMRLAPVPIRHWRDRKEMVRIAKLQSRTTHGADEAVEYSALLAEIIAEAISGVRFQELMTGDLAKRVRGFRVGQPRREVAGTGYVVDSLHAAMWSVSRTTNFKSAVLMAANLGQDADTTAAVAGQIAGALYGLADIPEPWLEKLAWFPDLYDLAEDLFEAGKTTD